jgi:hypothetical protein
MSEKYSAYQCDCGCKRAIIPEHHKHIIINGEITGFASGSVLLVRKGTKENPLVFASSECLKGIFSINGV